MNMTVKDDSEYSKDGNRLHPRSLALLVFMCSIILFAGLGSSRLFDRDEPRNARCTDEMLAANDWVVPMFNGELRTHKPILIYWLEGMSYWVFGSNAWGARFPSACMGAITLFTLYQLVRRLTNAQHAFWSVAILATSLMFVVASRVATPDAPLIASSTLAVCGLVLSQLKRLRAIDSVEAAVPKDRRWLLIGYTAMGFAVLAKGPVGLVLPSLVAGAWLWMETHIQVASTSKRSSTPFGKFYQNCVAWLIDIRSGWKAFCALEPWWGVTLAIIIAAPWYVWVGMRTDGEWLRGFFFEHNLGRAMNAMEGHRGGLWFYPVAALVGVFPWSLVLLPTIFWTGYQFTRSDQTDSPTYTDVHATRRALRLGLLWMLVYMSVFSMASTKLPSYITPCYAGAAILIGGMSSDVFLIRVRIPRWLTICIAGVFFLASLFGVLAIAGLAAWEPMPKLWFALIWPAGFLVVVWTSLRSNRWLSEAWIPGSIFVSAVFFLAGMFAHAAPIADQYRSDLNTLLAQRYDDEGNPCKWKAVGTTESSWVYYLGETIQELPFPDSSSHPTISSIAEFLKQPGSRLIVDEAQIESLRQLLPDDLRLTAIATAPRFRPGSSFQKRPQARIAILCKPKETEEAEKRN